MNYSYNISFLIHIERGFFMELTANVTLYPIFQAVARTGNISKAAEELYISQPAVSKAIRRLEENLGSKLFHRSSRGVSLTDSGKLLYEQTKMAFLELARGEERLRHIQQLGVGHIRIGVSTTLCKYLLLPCLKAFTEQHPHIRISIQCQSTYQTMALLHSQKVDIGLIGEPEQLGSLAFERIGEIDDILVATPSYLKNLLEREPDIPKNPSAAQLLPYANLMLLDEENISRHYIDTYFRRYNMKTGTILEVSTMDLLIEFARIGLGIACVIGRFVQEDLNEGRLVPLSVAVPAEKRKVGFSFFKERPLSDSANQFLTFCRNFFLS